MHSASSQPSSLGQLLRDKLNRQHLEERIKFSVEVTRPITDQEFAIILKEFLQLCKDNNSHPKIAAIKRVREITGCSLTEGKNFVDSWFEPVRNWMVAEHIRRG